MQKRNKFLNWLRTWDSGQFDFSEDMEKNSNIKKDIINKEHPWKEKPIERIETREISVFVHIYPVLAAILCFIMIGFLMLTVVNLPRFGASNNPAHNEVMSRYVENGMAETGAVNIVAGVILDYRAFDTLGESHVLYTAVTAVLMLLLSFKGTTESEMEKNIMQADPLLKNTAKIIVPLVIVYGIYVILNGHLGPGGGFAGGAVIGSGLILYAISFGFNRLEAFLNFTSFRIIVLCALCFYSVAKCYSFFCGSNHIETIFSPGTPGMIFSAGLILPLNIAVGIVVACTMYGFYSIFQRGRI